MAFVQVGLLLYVCLLVRGTFVFCERLILIKRSSLFALVWGVAIMKKILD